MSIVDGKYAMKGGPTDTLFGLIGATRGLGASGVKSLGGLVDGGAPSAPKPSALLKKKTVQTERSICGMNATKLPGAHFGQIPYAGQFMKTVGAKV
jgi:hypothetical protein